MALSFALVFLLALSSTFHPSLGRPRRAPAPQSALDNPMLNQFLSTLNQRFPNFGQAAQPGQLPTQVFNLTQNLTNSITESIASSIIALNNQVYAAAGNIPSALPPAQAILGYALSAPIRFGALFSNALTPPVVRAVVAQPVGTVSNRLTSLLDILRPWIRPFIPAIAQATTTPSPAPVQTAQQVSSTPAPVAEASTTAATPAEQARAFHIHVARTARMLARFQPTNPIRPTSAQLAEPRMVQSQDMMQPIAQAFASLVTQYLGIPQ